MLNFNENQVTINTFIPITGTLIVVLFMPNYLFFICVFFFIFLDLLDPDPHSECGSGTRRPIECGSKWIRIRNTGDGDGGGVGGRGRRREVTIRVDGHPRLSSKTVPVFDDSVFLVVLFCPYFV
jgi:hypothetical protein